MPVDEKLAILGGCGHVGLPLAVTFASHGADVTIVDVNASAVAHTNHGTVPFMERGAEELLKRHLGKNLRATTDQSAVAAADVVICVVGTPIDDHLNPQVGKLLQVVTDLVPHLRPDQLFVLRSTVFPGATAKVADWLDRDVPGIDVAYCPERVAQGYAVQEIESLPQLVSGASPRAAERAGRLFSRVARKIIFTSAIEAELGKLICNSWRYITFAVANQFYALCASNGIDYGKVHAAITEDYPRLRGLPTPGFAAGPCLFKDTMQLAAFCNNEFSLGQTAMLVNEGFPRVLMNQLRRLDLHDKTVGLLGLAFKGENDDTRESLAFKMRKLLLLEARRVICTDEFVKGPDVLPLEQVLADSDVLVVCAPHKRYAALRPEQPTLDPWNHLGRGGLLL